MRLTVKTHQHPHNTSAKVNLPVLWIPLCHMTPGISRNILIIVILFISLVGDVGTRRHHIALLSLYFMFLAASGKVHANHHILWIGTSGLPTQACLILAIWSDSIQLCEQRVKTTICSQVMGWELMAWLYFSVTDRTVSCTVSVKLIELSNLMEFLINFRIVIFSHLAIHKW